MATDTRESAISLNALTNPLVDSLLEDAAILRLTTSVGEDGSMLVDAGVDSRGGIEAGLRIARICMAGLGQVEIGPASWFSGWPWQVEVRTSPPVLACLGSQYAGWSLSVKGDKAAGTRSFRALGSGPARALAVKEPLFQELGYRDQAQRTCLVLETDQRPPPSVAEKVSRDCGIDPSGLTMILTPTGALAGVVQIAARVVEVALHKAHVLEFPLHDIVDAAGCTPLPPPTADALEAMGRTNDTILFGGQVHLFVTGPDSSAEQLARELPSSTSRDYGKPFAKVFEDYQFDFFQVDPMLFSPAQVAVTALDSGRTFRHGRLDEALLERSFASTSS